MRLLSTSVSVLALALLPLTAEAAGHAGASAGVAVASRAAAHPFACSAAALGTAGGCYERPDWAGASYTAPPPAGAPVAPVARHMGEGPLTVEKSAGVTVVRGPGSHHAAP